LRFTPEDTGMQPQDDTASYEDEMQQIDDNNDMQQTSQAGGGLQKYSSMLREVNQIISQLNDMGIMQQMNMGQQQNQAANPGQAEQNMQQTQGNQGTNSDMQTQQVFKQVQGGLNLLMQQEELGPDATLEETQQYVMQNEQELKQVIKQFVKQQKEATP